MENLLLIKASLALLLVLLCQPIHGIAAMTPRKDGQMRCFTPTTTP